MLTNVEGTAMNISPGQTARSLLAPRGHNIELVFVNGVDN
jgi:hypothetical protein